MIWTPPKVSRELQAGTAQYRAEVIAQARRDATLDFWTRELRKLDPYLELIRAKENSTLMRPGFYYVLRHNPGAPPTLKCVEGPDGEFVEPTSAIFDLLREQDMWNDRAEKDRKRIAREADEARRRRKEREEEDRVEELRERWAAVSRTQVSLNRSSCWTQNVNGRRPKEKP